MKSKKLSLRTTTVKILDPESAANVRGGWTSIFSCDIEPETKAFTNCEYCPTETLICRLSANPHICP